MHLMMRNLNSPRTLPKWRLHPLIYTRLEFNLAQDMAVCQREEKKAPTDPAHTGPVGATLKGAPQGRSMRSN